MKSRKKPQIDQHFLSNPPLVLKQKGYDCKHYALAAALQWLYASNLIEQEPAPARRREKPEYKGPSLRWHLKKSFHSAVGEVHNVEDLAALAETQTQVAAYFCECKTEAHYNATLKKAIQLGLTPLVFFDVETHSKSPRCGLPIEAKGNLEHAVVVVGYGHDQFNKLFFRVTQWARYFDLDAKELFRSTSQLSQTKSDRENYFKITTIEGEGAWLPEDYILGNKYEKQIFKRLVETSPTKNGGVCQKILILDSTIHPKLNLKAMPVKFYRPSVVSSSESKSELQEDTYNGEEWDEIIQENLEAFKQQKLKQEAEELERSHQLFLWSKIKKFEENRDFRPSLIIEKGPTPLKWHSLFLPVQDHVKLDPENRVPFHPFPDMS